MSLTSCITEYEPGGVTNTEGMLVIEAYVIAPTGTSIKISRTKDLQSEDAFVRVSGAQVVLIDDSGNVVATAEEDEAGEYLIAEELAFLPDVRYALDFVIENNHYQSTFEAPISTPEIDDLSWVLKSDGYEIDILLSTHDSQLQTEYYLWRYEEDWEYTAQYYANARWDPIREELVISTATDNLYYCWDKDHSKSLIIENVKALQDGVLKNKIVATLKGGSTRFHSLYSILLKQYSISHEAYKYYHNLQKNVSESGSLFAPQPTEVRGNITNLSGPDETVIGYALMATETTRRIYINGQAVPKMKGVFNVDCTVVPEVGFDTPAIAFINGWGVLSYFTTAGGMYSYRYRICVDCRLQGGTRDRPDFWPNDHW